MTGERAFFLTFFCLFGGNLFVDSVCAGVVSSSLSSRTSLPSSASLQSISDNAHIALGSANLHPRALTPTTADNSNAAAATATDISQGVVSSPPSLNHPSATQSPAFIAGLSVGLCALALFLGLIFCFVRTQRRRRRARKMGGSQQGDVEKGGLVGGYAIGRDAFYLKSAGTTAGSRSRSGTGTDTQASLTEKGPSSSVGAGNVVFLNLPQRLEKSLPAPPPELAAAPSRPTLPPLRISSIPREPPTHQAVQGPLQRSQTQSTHLNTGSSQSPGENDISQVQRLTRGLSFVPRTATTMPASRPASRSSLGTIGTATTMPALEMATQTVNMNRARAFGVGRVRRTQSTSTGGHSSPSDPSSSSADIHTMQRLTRGLSFATRGGGSLSRPASRSSLGTLVGTVHTTGTRSRRTSTTSMASIHAAARQRTLSTPDNASTRSLRVPTRQPSRRSARRATTLAVRGQYWSPEPSPRHWQNVLEMQQAMPPATATSVTETVVGEPGSLDGRGEEARRDSEIMPTSLPTTDRGRPLPEPILAKPPAYTFSVTSPTPIASTSTQPPTTLRALPPLPQKAPWGYGVVWDVEAQRWQRSESLSRRGGRVRGGRPRSGRSTKDRVLAIGT